MKVPLAGMAGLLFAAVFSPAQAGVVSDVNIGYAVTLPPNWVQLKTKPIQHYFRDSTKQYRSQISILQYSLDKVTYPTPDTWTQAQFIGYMLSVETSAYPFGAVTYFDSTSAAKLGTHWAPEAFSVLYPADGNPTYCEYLRYCANGDFGYEIYAIGDSTDMANNVDFYAGIIATMQLSTPTAGLPPTLKIGTAAASEPKGKFFDLNGRSREILYRTSGPASAETRRAYRVQRDNTLIYPAPR